MDVFQPTKPNGCAVIFMVSGGFFSSHEAINPAMYAPMLDRGYTVFAVVHGSQPKFQIPEMGHNIMPTMVMSVPCSVVMTRGTHAPGVDARICRAR